MKRVTLIVLSAVIFINIFTSALFDTGAVAEHTSKDGNYKYIVIDNKFAELKEYTGKGEIVLNSDGSYTIPSEVDGYIVKFLGYGLFSETNVPSARVIIPDTVTYIDNSVFDHYDGEGEKEPSPLKSIVIPSSVTYIGDGAFAYCLELESVTIPGTVRHMGNDVFTNCYKLKTVTIKSGATKIGDYAFDHCKSLSSVKLPETMNLIGKHAFYDCTSLKELTVYEGTNFAKKACGYYFDLQTCKEKRFPDLNLT